MEAMLPAKVSFPFPLSLLYGANSLGKIRYDFGALGTKTVALAELI